MLCTGPGFHGHVLPVRWKVSTPNITPLHVKIYILLGRASFRLRYEEWKRDRKIQAVQAEAAAALDWRSNSSGACIKLGGMFAPGGYRISDQRSPPKCFMRSTICGSDARPCDDERRKSNQRRIRRVESAKDTAYVPLSCDGFVPGRSGGGVYGCFSMTFFSASGADISRVLTHQ